MCRRFYSCRKEPIVPTRCLLVFVVYLSSPLLRVIYRGPVRPVSPLFRFKSAQEASRCRLRALKIGLCDSRWYLTCLQEAPRSPQDVPKRPRSSANDAFEVAKTLKNWCKNTIFNIFGFIASTWLLNLRNCS